MTSIVSNPPCHKNVLAQVEPKLLSMFRRVGPRSRQTFMKQMAPIQKLERRIDCLSKSALCLNGPVKTDWSLCHRYGATCPICSTSQRIPHTPACVSVVCEVSKRFWLLHKQLIHMLVRGEFCILRTGAAPNDWFTSWQSSCLARLADR